jgi:SET domain-containing protein
LLSVSRTSIILDLKLALTAFIHADSTFCEDLLLNNDNFTPADKKTFKADSYRPLPASVTINNSEIDGLGLFAVQNIKEGTYIGETHFKIDENRDWMRTPLGGFINHSEQSNAEISLTEENIRGLTAKRDIVKGEEITVFYTLY